MKLEMTLNEEKILLRTVLVYYHLQFEYLKFVVDTCVFKRLLLYVNN